jgi:hypothetical protein
MKKVQSVICALALALSLSSTVFATRGILVSDVKSDGILVSDVKADGILVSDLFTWGDVSGLIVSIFGNIHV